MHVGEGLLVFVGGLGITCASLARPAVGHQSAHVLPRPHDDNARIGDLGVLVGGDMVLVVVCRVCQILYIFLVCWFSYF